MECFTMNSIHKIDPNQVYQTDSDISDLLKAISEIDRITNDTWMQSLADRKKKELEFHDSHRDRAGASACTPNQDTDSYEKFYGNKKYYNATNRSRDHVNNWIEKNAKGKVFLDYACGNGVNAITAAKAGAKIALGLDISPVSVQNARTDAASAGVKDNTFFFQADAENTKLPDNSVDFVICSGMLHHLDLSYAFPELRRIMKPGAKILAVEALDYNPAIKLYRMLTPAMRTDWEKAHILSLKDLRFASRFFEVKNVKYWHIFGIITPHVPPVIARFLEKIDTLFEKIPLAQLMAWIFTFELQKTKDN
jgi:ubiquinone/menaquinone biosynthesis C-methylase UbiE